MARGELHTSRLVGRRIQDVRWPTGVRVGAVVRGEGRSAEVHMPHHDLMIEDGDHIVVFIPSKRLVREVASNATACAPFSQNSKVDVCSRSGQAQPGQSKPSGWFAESRVFAPSTGMSCCSRCWVTDFSAGQPPACLLYTSRCV